MSKSPEDIFLDGFNSGYTLANLDPKLAEDLSVSLQTEEDHFVQGFQAGRNEYIREIQSEMTYEDFIANQKKGQNKLEKDDDELEIEF